MQTRQYIEGLCRSDHRGSTTDNERQAAEYIRDEMTGLGLESRLEHFVSHTSFSWVYMLIYGGFFVAGWIGWRHPFIGVALCALMLALFVGECTSRWKAAANILPKRPSQNVLGILKNESARNKLIFVAHYDSSKSGLSFHPSLVGSFRSSFMTSVVMKAILIQVLIIHCFGGGGALLSALRVISTAYMLVPILLLAHRELFGRYVQGASDNASGVATMLGAAEELVKNPPKNFEVWFLATGCEEVNLVGMSAFMRAHQYEIDHGTTHFLNIDNMGGGSLRYITGEGMLKLYPSCPEMVSMAEKLTSKEEFKDVRPHAYRLATLDALVASSRGYKVLSLMGMDESDGIPHWHWPTDTLENVDFALSEKGARFALGLVRAMDEKADLS
jgi:hypothetical protein